MKKLALLLLALPLAACATTPGQTSVSYNHPICTPSSHWEVATGCGAFAAPDWGGAPFPP